MKRKTLACLLVLVFLPLVLTGCRARITGGDAGNGPLSAEEGAFLSGNGAAGTGAAEAFEDQNHQPVSSENEENSSVTQENPDAQRKEYDESAPAEITEGTERFLHMDGEGGGAGALGMETGESVYRLNDEAEQTATQATAAPQADRKGVDPDAEKADSAMTYYTVLLQDRLDTLFECQRAYAYWETSQDHVTVHKTSPEHSMMTASGVYDVSARLLPENLRVEDGWVVRKNPGLIIKVIDGVLTPQRAGEAVAGLANRGNWSQISAVREGKVLLLSEALLTSPHLRTAAMLIIARAWNPSLFSDVDPDKALQMLTEEAGSPLPAGIYYYQSGEGL